MPLLFDSGSCPFYYASAQRRFLDFCAQDNSLSPSGSALPASEDMLIRFCCHLADTLHHSSIKVYLYGADVQADSLSIQAASGFISSALRRTPFAKVAIFTLELVNVISGLYTPIPSIYTSVAQLLAHSFFSLMAPLYIANGWHPIFNLSSLLLWTLVATPVIASALALLLQQPLVAYQITSSRHLADGPAMRIRSIFTLPSVLSWG